MIGLSVIIPTWDIKRALTRCAELMERESLMRKVAVEYVIVVPRAESLPIGKWPNGLDPEDVAIYIEETEHYLSPVEAMAIGAQRADSESSILAFLHDDVLIEPMSWEDKIAKHLAAYPRCGLVGFGGGVGFADIDIYKVPYDYRQLARVDFVSNMREAESHGRRVSEPMRVAALDGFALITSREFYMQAGDRLIWQNPPLTDPPSVGAPKLVDSNGAWEVCLKDGVPYHMYDAWISCRAAELGYETWMLPVACHHQGGQTSVGRQTEYAQVVRRLGFVDAQDLYDQAHRRIYERFAGVLPIRVRR